MSTGLTWTQSNGGPLVLMDEGLLPGWHGVTNLDDPCDPATDYGRACLVQGEIGLLPVAGGGTCLVLGDDPTLPACAVPVGPGLLILQTFGSERIPFDLDALWSTLTGGAPPPEALRFTVGPSGRLHLFDSAFPGPEGTSAPSALEERLAGTVTCCPTGEYRVLTRHLEIAGDELLVHALLPEDTCRTAPRRRSMLG